MVVLTAERRTIKQPNNSFVQPGHLRRYIVVSSAKSRKLKAMEDQNPAVSLGSPIAQATNIANFEIKTEREMKESNKKTVLP